MVILFYFLFISLNLNLISVFMAPKIHFFHQFSFCLYPLFLYIYLGHFFSFLYFYAFLLLFSVLSSLLCHSVYFLCFSFFITNNFEESFHGVVANGLICEIVVSEFKLQLDYYANFWTNSLGKNMNPLFPTQYCFSTSVDLTLNNTQRLIHH